jgi:hypothetical protein
LCFAVVCTVEGRNVNFESELPAEAAENNEAADAAAGVQTAAGVAVRRALTAWVLQH